MSVQTSDNRRNAGFEAFLISAGVKPEQIVFQVDVPVDRFDRATSLNNQARLNGKLDREVVERFALAMIDGAVFPPMISYEGRRGLVAIDGNHRLHGAIEADRKTVDNYLIETADMALIELLTRTFNAGTGGKPIERGDVLEQALTLLGAKYPIELVARITRMKVGTLRDRNRERETQRRIKDAGVRDWDKLPTTTVLRLGRIQSDVTLKAAAEFIIEAQASLDAATALVQRILDTRSEAEGLRVVEEEKAAFLQRVRDIRNAGVRNEEPQSAKVERQLRWIARTLLSGRTPQQLGYLHLEEVERARACLFEVQNALTNVLDSAERLIRRAS